MPLHLIVTGASGFVGRRIVGQALADGHSVSAWIRDLGRAPREGPLAGARWRAADLLDASSVHAAVQDEAPDVVVHAAALVHGEPDALHRINVDGTRTLVDALIEGDGMPRLVYLSSFATEDTPPTPYSDSKLEAEVVVKGGGLPWVVLRPTLVYGSGDSNNMPPLVDALATGSMWLPAGGRTTIQPVHVQDVAAACLAAATREGAVGHTYRLGGPEPISVRAFREAVRDASGGRAVLRSLPLPVLALGATVLALLGRTGPAGVVAFHRADHAVDSSDARRELGFAPRPLAEGLAETFGSV